MSDIPSQFELCAESDSMSSKQAEPLCMSLHLRRRDNLPLLPAQVWSGAEESGSESASSVRVHVVWNGEGADQHGIVSFSARTV